MADTLQDLTGGDPPRLLEPRPVGVDVVPEGVTQQDAHGVRRRPTAPQPPPPSEPVLQRRDELGGEWGLGTLADFVALGGQIVDELHGLVSRGGFGEGFGVQPHHGEMPRTGGLDDLSDEHAGDRSGQWGCPTGTRYSFAALSGERDPSVPEIRWWRRLRPG